MARHEEHGRTVSAVVETGKSPRLLSLDAFRGLTILGMILVNNPGSWSDMYWPLGHARWHGWTPTDLIFPFFLFIVGTSLSYSLRKYRGGVNTIETNPPLAPPLKGGVYWRIVRRTVVLFALGLLLNSTGMLMRYAFGQSETISFETLRYLGVLQRIALVYLIASLVVLHVGVRSQAVLATVLLLGYWALFAWLPNPENYAANLSPEHNVVQLVDRAVIGEAHMYTQARTEKTEPEGLLSTLPATVTALFGYWTGLFVQRRGADARTVGILIACGAVCVLVGLGWDRAFPINKKLWTGSFVLVTGGWAMILLAACLWMFDVRGWRRLARPFAIVGVNAIFVFVASGVMANLLNIVRIDGEPAKQWIYDMGFTSWIEGPKLASLAFALATVAFWWIILWAMARRGWSIRV
jgi:predicted acyltransferase